MVIAAAASKFSAEKMGSATNISGRDITSMPTVSRSITDVTRLSPYGGNGMSFAGQDGRTANFTVDGANFNNNFGLSDGLPGGGSPISIDAIEEMQVVISPTSGSPFFCSALIGKSFVFIIFVGSRGL